MCLLEVCFLHRHGMGATIGHLSQLTTGGAFRELPAATCLADVLHHPANGIRHIFKAIGKKNTLRQYLLANNNGFRQCGIVCAANVERCRTHVAGIIVAGGRDCHRNRSTGIAVSGSNIEPFGYPVYPPVVIAIQTR